VILGVLSDTHGVLLPEVIEAFAGVDLVLHAGDVGAVSVLRRLEKVAPVKAVYGNVDGRGLREELPQVVEANADGLVIVVTHGDQFGYPGPRQLREAFPHADVLVYGHTHRPVVSETDGAALVLNPGSAGPLPNRATVAILETAPGSPPKGRIVPLAE